MIGPGKLLGILLVLAMVAGACGGDDSSVSENSNTTTTDTQAPARESDDAPTTVATASDKGEGGSPSGGNVNTAVVTIRGTRYEFNMEPDAIHRCDPDFFGAFWGIGVSADGSGGNLDLLLPPAGDPAFEDDPPSIKVKDPASDLEWVADPEFVALYAQLEQIKSQVDSWTLDGPTVTGVATFVETNAAFAFVGGVGEEPQPVEGAFEVICAEQ